MKVKSVVSRVAHCHATHVKTLHVSTQNAHNSGLNLGNVFIKNITSQGKESWRSYKMRWWLLGSWYWCAPLTHAISALRLTHAASALHLAHDKLSQSLAHTTSVRHVAPATNAVVWSFASAHSRKVPSSKLGRHILHPDWDFPYSSSRTPDKHLGTASLVHDQFLSNPF